MAQTSTSKYAEGTSQPNVAPPKLFERLKSKFFKRCSKWEYKKLDDMESSQKKIRTAASGTETRQAEENKTNKLNSDKNTNFELKAAKERVQRLKAKRSIPNTESHSDQTKEEELKQAKEKVEQIKKMKKTKKQEEKEIKRSKRAERGATSSPTYGSYNDYGNTALTMSLLGMTMTSNFSGGCDYGGGGCDYGGGNCGGGGCD
ncbi:hypothetical protein CkaCkLH20_08321 [Colletotrichum karsti]|uniref:Uncharacterized protein n=1 Tax=Colletotrichum karsti TaxID=1095194 RepID=A0A9P6I0R2_9PEZI|nr:uncharacterized protein CkaCkLH20_08321 [Colletotrichum karsti]KAF9874338.1 hypothetical protein CkaCkLH20_08321 [Colletotrichum karsti]